MYIMRTRGTPFSRSSLVYHTNKYLNAIPAFIYYTNKYIESKNQNHAPAPFPFGSYISFIVALDITVSGSAPDIRPSYILSPLFPLLFRLVTYGPRQCTHSVLHGPSHLGSSIFSLTPSFSRIFCVAPRCV